MMALVRRVACNRILGRLATAYLLTSNVVERAGVDAFHLKPLAVGLQRASRPFSTRQQARLISISDAYDGGNIQLLGQDVQEDGSVVIRLNIKPDPYTELEKKEHFQYFSFRSTLASLPNDDESGKQIVKYVIENAGEASYAEAWDESTVFFSTSINDPHSWKRQVETRYKDGKLSWTHVHSSKEGTSSVYFCYFPPFSYAQHLELIAKCCQSETAHVHSIGQTLDGAEIECVKTGTGSTVCWIIHRQHPGEHMAEYYAEGLLTRLLGLQSNGDVDGLVRRLLSKYTFYIVPSVNPDGGVRGHLRTNACGANLNREWADSPDYDAPTMERSPEIYAILESMKATGCDVFVDVHGDEALPYNFLAQPSVPNWGPRLEALHGAFLAAYVRANPDMQQEYAYEPCDYADGDILNIASDQVAFRFDCLSVTLEMPFKDCLSNPDPARGWSPTRASSLGSSVLEPLMYIHPYLRDENEFWKTLPKGDSYIRPTSSYK